MSSAEVDLVDPLKIRSPNPDAQQNSPESINGPQTKSQTYIDRIKFYGITKNGRIDLANLLITLISVICQHVMGTCYHAVSDGTHLVRWHVFTPPFGAGPHTATFHFILCWTTFIYCIERISSYITMAAEKSKRRDIITHGFIALLNFLAVGFNIWGYVLCSSKSQIYSSSQFSPGICRGDSQTCILLLVGILTAILSACIFLSHQVLTLTALIKSRKK